MGEIEPKNGGNWAIKMGENNYLVNKLSRPIL